MLKENGLNREIDLRLYWPTSAPSIFVDRNLTRHPFRIQKDGVFCGDCLMVNDLKAARNKMSMHKHDCTVSKKDWKIIVCADPFEADYYISLDKFHFKKR